MLHKNVQNNIIENIQDSHKQSKCPTDEWINQAWYTHMMKYNLAIKKNEILTHAYNMSEP